jgi:16S rRNA C967 or C1407 C5-methylase (RsmB/RsmF family)
VFLHYHRHVRAIAGAGIEHQQIDAVSLSITDGLLVYSTCSLEPEENEGVVESVPAHLVVQTMRRIPGRDAGDGFFAAVIKSG